MVLVRAIQVIGHAARISAVALLFAAVLVATICPSTAGTLVTEIRIEGRQRVAEMSIRERLSIAPGRPFDGAAGDRSIRALFETGEFADVRIDRQGGAVLVRVVENPLVAEVQIKGNASIASETLLPLLKSTAGTPYSRSKGEADARRLRDHYRGAGRHQTTVSVAQVPADEGRVDVTFSVVESPINKVVAIRFPGARQISASELEGVTATTASGLFDFLRTTVSYDPERAALDRELIRRHYLRNGFADVAVAPPRADYDAATGTYTLTFEITEGDRYAAGRHDIDVRAIGVDKAMLSGLLPEGRLYDGVAADRAADLMTARLHAAKVDFARVVVVPKRDPATRTVAVTYRIEEGPRLYVSRIDITGNTRTNDTVIRRELKLAEGDPFSTFGLDTAKRRLVRTGFFKSVEIVPSEDKRAPDRVALAVRVVEEDTGDLGFGIGYSSTEGAVGDVSFTERNLLGNGQYLKLKAAGSLTRFDTEVSFTEPRFLGSDVAAGFDLFWRDADRTLQSSYKSQRIGGTARIAFPITDTITTGLSYGFTRNTLYDVGASASPVIRDAVPSFPQNKRTTYDTSAIGTTTTYDGRDNAKNPTRGIYVSAGGEFAGLGGDVRTTRTSGDVRGYIPLGHGFVLAGRLTGGMVQGWGGQTVRLLDMYYRGGDLVRGFAVAGLGPRDIGSANADALGGMYYYGTSAELRFPLPFLPSASGLSAGIFADAGSLFGASPAAARVPTLAGNAATPRASVGAQLAWDSPVGQLRLGYAFPLVAQPGDKTQPLSFGFGPSF